MNIEARNIDMSSIKMFGMMVALAIAVVLVISVVVFILNQKKWAVMLKLLQKSVKTAP